MNVSQKLLQANDYLPSGVYFIRTVSRIISRKFPALRAPASVPSHQSKMMVRLDCGRSSGKRVVAYLCAPPPAARPFSPLTGVHNGGRNIAPEHASIKTALRQSCATSRTTVGVSSTGVSRLLLATLVFVGQCAMSAAQTWGSSAGSSFAAHSTAANSPFPSNGGFQLDTTDFGTNTDLSSWTLIYDIKIDASESSTYIGVMQTDPANNNDADIFFKKSGSNYQVGIGNYYGSLPKDTWMRLAFACDDTDRLYMYRDGTLIEWTGSGVNSRHILHMGTSLADFLLMTDDSASETGAGRLAAFAMTNSFLSASAISNLGGPTSSGIFAAGTSSVLEFRLDGSACMQAAIGVGACAASNS